MKNQAIHHPKTADLAERIAEIIRGDSLNASALPFGLCHTIAIGTLERLWHYTSTYAPAGDIGKLSPSRIADAVGFPPQHATELVDAMVTARLLDRKGQDNRTLVIHDWPEHAQDSVHVYLARRGLLFADGTPPKLYLLPKEERAKAEAKYRRRPAVTPDPAPDHHLPIFDAQTPDPAPEAAPDPAPDEADPQHQTPENVTPPHPTTTPPPTAAMRNGTHPRRVIAHPKLGSSSSSGDRNSEQEQAYQALRKEPFPDVTPKKAAELAATHPLDHILAAIERASARRSKGEDAGAGLIVTWLQSGEAEAMAQDRAARISKARIRRGRAWWTEASAEARQDATRGYQRHTGITPDPNAPATDDLADFIARCFEGKATARTEPT